mmetsp:Transcript_12189/g.15912  ORF Transcript_12189/g.15912 Transcript_12189/m.15912 type:complete len:546 (-) Transcript_12189:53-1690(-)
MKSPSSNTSRASPSSTSRNGNAIATTTIKPDAQTLYALQIPHVYGTSDHSIGGRTQFSSKERSPPSPLHSINNSSPVVHPIVKSPPYLLMDAPPPSVYAPNSNYHPQQQPYHTPRMLPCGPPAPPAPPAIAPGLPQIAVPMPNHGATWAHACHDPGLHVPGYSSTQYPPSASHTAAPSAAAPSYPPHAHGPPPALPSSSTMDSTTTHAGYHPTADRTAFQSTYYNQGIMTSSLQCSALRSPRHNITSSISSVSQHTPVPPYTSGPPSMTSAPAAAQQDGQSNNIPQSQNSDSTSLISRPISNLSQSNHANPYVLVTQQESGQDVKNWVVPPPAKRSKPASGSTDMVTNRAVCELQRAISNSLSSIICIFKSPANNHEQRTDLVYGNAKFLNRFSCEIDEMRVKKKMVPGSLKQLIYADDRNVFCGSVELIKKDPKSNPRFVVRIIDKINALPEMGQDCSYSYSFVEMSMQVASISEHYLVTMRPLYATGEYTSRHIRKDCLRSNIGTNTRFEEITDDGMIMNSLVRSYEDEKNRVTPLLGPSGIC